MKFLKKTAAALIAAAIGAAVLAGCGGSGDQVLMTLNGEYEITRSAAVYYAEYIRSVNSSVDFSIEENDASAKQLLENQLIYNYALLMWAREEYGITTESEDIVATVDQAIASASDGMSDEEYAESLAQINLTPELYRQLLLESAVQNSLNQMALGEGGELSAVTEQEYSDFILQQPVYAAKHILILANGDFEGALERINAIAADLEAGADFDALMNQYSEDTGLAANPYGYAYTEGTMVSEFEDAVKALGIGEVSEPVMSSYGYHLIMRVEVGDQFDITDLIVESRVDAKISQYTSAIEIVYSNGFEDLKFSDIAPETKED